MPKRVSAKMGISPSMPTPRKVSRGRTIPRAAATNMPTTMKPPFMGMGRAMGSPGPTKKTRRKA
jgi:hypothetical protein